MFSSTSSVSCALLSPIGDGDLIRRGSPELRYGAKQDPFEFGDDHPAARLRLNSTAFREFVLPKDPVEQGLRLEKIWQHCLLRRNYRSAYPFKSDRIIGRSLPACEMYVSDLTFDQEI